MIAEQTQSELTAEFGDSAAGLLNEENALEMRAWLIKDGGCYRKEEIKETRKPLTDSERLWSASDNLGVWRILSGKIWQRYDAGIIGAVPAEQMNRRGTVGRDGDYLDFV
jgi:hypothetical protein